MSHLKEEFTESFWKFVLTLERLEVKTNISYFCSDLDVNENTFFNYVLSLKTKGILIKVDDEFLYPFNREQVELGDLSLSEWVAIEYMFSEKEMKTQVNSEERMVLQEALINRLESSIIFKSPIKVKFNNGGENIFYAHRMIFIEGTLSCIFEETTDKSLVYFELHKILDVEAFAIRYDPQFTPFEINHFVNNLRMINGNEERLVLKIFGKEDLNFLPKYHFLSSPYVAMGKDGDIIWAATIEMCDDIYQWLYSMKDHVEVLDPTTVKKEFSRYCQMKKNYPVNKKAS